MHVGFALPWLGWRKNARAAASFRDWGSLPSPAIDVIAAALKRNRRWKCDGPSLRALNQHWCRVLDPHITSLQPHSSRRLAMADFRELRKFPNLISVDVASLLCCLPCRKYSLTAIRRVTAQLQILQSFTHLSIRRTLLDSLLSEEYRDIWSGFSQIRSLTVELAVEDMDAEHRLLDRLLELFPKVTHTELTVKHAIRLHHLSILCKLESLGLHVSELSGSIDWISDLTCLTRLEVGSGGKAELDFTALNRLKRLKSLSLPIRASEELCALSPALLKGLTRLEIASCVGVVAIPSDFFPRLSQLRTLCLKSVSFREEDLTQYLPRLSELHLESVVVSSFLHFLSQQRLQSLSYVGVRNAQLDVLSPPWPNLAGLTRLTCSVLNQPTAIAQILRLTQLETLEIICGHRTAVDLRRLKGLPNLRELSVRFVRVHGVAVPEIVLSLEFLTRLEKISLRGLGRSNELLQKLQSLSWKVPQLKVELR